MRMSKGARRSLAGWVLALWAAGLFQVPDLWGQDTEVPERACR